MSELDKDTGLPVKLTLADVFDEIEITPAEASAIVRFLADQVGFNGSAYGDLGSALRDHSAAIVSPENWEGGSFARNDRTRAEREAQERRSGVQQVTPAAQGQATTFRTLGTPLETPSSNQGTNLPAPLSHAERDELNALRAQFGNEPRRDPTDSDRFSEPLQADPRARLNPQMDTPRPESQRESANVQSFTPRTGGGSNVADADRPSHWDPSSRKWVYNDNNEAVPHMRDRGAPWEENTKEDPSARGSF